MNTLIKIGDAARQLDVSPITLRRLESRGAIPQARRHPQTGARYWLSSELEDIRRVVEPRLRSVSSGPRGSRRGDVNNV